MALLEREGPLRVLSDAVDAAAEGGCAVLVTGEPGIGKTALVTQFAAGLPNGMRVMWGWCDDLSIPRPFGPLRDIAGSSSGRLGAALHQASPAAVHQAVIDELRDSPSPTLLVVEDLHWADDATIDLLTVIGRRIAVLPVVMVLTFRDSELSAGHRLHRALASIPRAAQRHLPLAPLSPAAVALLAGADADCDSVFEITGGNPFFVTELLAAGASTLPPSVSDAVLARVARLNDESRALLDLVSLVPARVDVRILDALLPGWSAAAEAPERMGLLSIDAHAVSYRHELARRAVEASIPMARRRQLHGKLLDELVAMGAQAADVVHHAEAAGAIDVVADYALVAAKHAASVGSTRQAYDHFRRAAQFADRFPDADRAALFEEFALVAYTVGHLDDAFAALEHAIELQLAREDRAALGRCTRVLSRLHWYAGDGERAERSARDAIALLEPLGDSDELARAYSALSQLAMLASHTDDALEWGTRAVELAERLGDERTRAHALVNIGSARTDLDPDDTETLRHAHVVAAEAGDHHEAVRALLNLAYHEMCWVRPEVALRDATCVHAYATRHEVDTLAGYVMTMIAWLRLRAGAWAEAEELARHELEKQTSVAQLLARTVLAELALRRGDPDAPLRIAELAELADGTGELQRIEPALELQLEAALLAGEPLPVERIEHVLAVADDSPISGWVSGRLAAWAVVAGLPAPTGIRMPTPHEAIARRDWFAAANAFADVGWRYDEALMLSLTDDRDALVAALRTARALGAVPLARRVTQRLRALGHHVPRGPTERSRSHPAGLTSRQLDVLRLLAEGLTNAGIAERLYVSPRTAEHHVSAVIAKLGVSSRHDAARAAARLLAGMPPTHER